MKLQTLIEQEREAEEALRTYQQKESPEARLKRKASQAKLERLKGELHQAKEKEQGLRTSLQAKNEETSSLHKLSQELLSEGNITLRKAQRARGEMSSIASKALRAGQEAKRIEAEISELEKELNTNE